MPDSFPTEPEFILIRAGEFLMGSNAEKDKYSYYFERPQHTVTLSNYYLSRTPVTNRQYAIFVRETYHRPPKHWKDVKPPRNKKDHPVVNVTWHDALAYCNWLSIRIGRICGLPSQAEWEKGARGNDGRIYPWGDEWDSGYCNTSKSKIRDTTPVGAFPQGASPYGLLGMAGNVWEWTRSLWGPWNGEEAELQFVYPYQPDDGRENLAADDNVWRVLRGDSFCGGMRFARCAYCIALNPRFCGAYYGFRVMSGDSIRSHLLM